MPYSCLDTDAALQQLRSVFLFCLLHQLPCNAQIHSCDRPIPFFWCNQLQALLSNTAAPLLLGKLHNLGHRMLIDGLLSVSLLLLAAQLVPPSCCRRRQCKTPRPKRPHPTRPTTGHNKIQQQRSAQVKTQHEECTSPVGNYSAQLLGCNCVSCAAGLLARQLPGIFGPADRPNAAPYRCFRLTRLLHTAQEGLYTAAMLCCCVCTATVKMKHLCSCRTWCLCQASGLVGLSHQFTYMLGSSSSATAPRRTLISNTLSNKGLCKVFRQTAAVPTSSCHASLLLKDRCLAGHTRSDCCPHVWA